MRVLTATFFGVGYVPWAPGTAGSIVAIPLALVLHLAGGPYLIAAATVALFALGIWAVAERASSDPAEYVIDEVVGQLLALLPISIIHQLVTQLPFSTLLGLTAMAFALFRFFDILKPGPIGLVDRRGDSLGIMLDDLLAGIAAALITSVAWVLWTL